MKERRCDAGSCLFTICRILASGGGWGALKGNFYSKIFYGWWWWCIELFPLNHNESREEQDDCRVGHFHCITALHGNKKMAWATKNDCWLSEKRPKKLPLPFHTSTLPHSSPHVLQVTHSLLVYRGARCILYTFLWKCSMKIGTLHSDKGSVLVN